MDTLNLYKSELKKFPNGLPKDEESRLAILAQSGDEKALEMLITANLAYVISVSKGYCNQGVEHQDLIQAGNLGMVEAAFRFDGNYGVKFTTYASSYIKNRIFITLTENSRPMSVSKYIAHVSSKVTKARSELDSVLNRPSNEYDIAEYLGFSVDLVQTCLGINVHPEELDKYQHEDSNETIGDMLGFETTDIDGLFDEKYIMSIVNKLKPKEIDLITSVFGLNGKDSISCAEYARMNGISRQAVNSTKQSLLRKLKRIISNKELEQI